MDSIKAFVKRLGKRGTLIIITVLILGIALCLLGSGESGTARDSDLTEYKKTLEEELESACSRVFGAGRCRVIVTLAEGERREYRGSSVECVIPPRVLGVTVLCEGGDSASVRSDISDMMAALFDIGKNRICVLKLS